MKLPANSMNNILTVNNLSVQFDSVTVLDRVSFTIGRGEFIGLIGPNGAGKSTLIKSILGLFPVSAGKYSFSSDVTVCYVPQHYILSEHVPVSVAEVVRMGSRKRLAREQIFETLMKVGLDRRMVRKNFHELSGGQKQRVMIARALVADPDVIFFDEPLSGVDVQTKMQIYSLLKKINEQGMTILFVSHDVEHVVDICDRILCLDKVLHKGCHPMEFAHGVRPSEKVSKIASECLVNDDKTSNTTKGSIHHHH